MTTRIMLNDVALRESAQVEGGSMSPRDQLTYVKMLLEGGIDCIEVGYPGSSEEQMENSKRIIEYVHTWDGPQIPLLSGLATADKVMIDAVKEAGCSLCHIYIPSSQEFISAMFNAAKYGDTLEGKQNWVVDQSVAMVEYAKSIGFDMIQYSPEDAARAGRDFICRLVEAVIKAGATVINIPDTTGLRVLNEFGDLINHIKTTVPNVDQVHLSVHCHNDSDNATNNALQAIMAGATVIEGTFYGLGERSGMTKFESILMNLATRKDVFGEFEARFDINHCVKIVNFISSALGMPAPRHWVVAGRQNSICSSGTHQAVEARAQTIEQGYYSWDPKRFGHKEVETVITQSSGRAGIKRRLEELGYSVVDDDLKNIYEEAMKISDAKSGAALDDRELIAVVQNVIADIPYLIKIKRCQAVGGYGTIPTAVITLEVDNRLWQTSAIGDGAFDAIMKAVIDGARTFYPELRNVDISLVDWRPIPITKGSEALADVYAAMRFGNGDGKIHAGRSVDLDTIQASAQAFANCISWYLYSLLGE